VNQESDELEEATSLYERRLQRWNRRMEFVVCLQGAPFLLRYVDSFIKSFSIQEVLPCS
jgi:hypothetical protein